YDFFYFYLYFSIIFFSLLLRRPLRSSLFPYTTLFRSIIIALLSIYLNFYFTFLGMNQVKGVDNAFMNALSPTVTFLLSFLFRFLDRKSTRLNSSHVSISYAVFCLKKKKYILLACLVYI